MRMLIFNETTGIDVEDSISFEEIEDDECTENE